MKKLRIIGLCLLLVFITSAFAPLQSAETAKLTIKNQTGEVFWIAFNGPETRWHQTIDGRNSLELLRGEYTYSYFACGQQVTGSIGMQKSKELVIRCQTQPGADGVKGDLVRFKINNQTSSALWISFTGPEAKWVQAPVGVSVEELTGGAYDYSYWACGRQHNETVRVKSGEILKIKCAAWETSSPTDTVKMTIDNRTKESFWIAFSGDVEKWAYLNPGKNVVEVIVGAYNYTYTACGKEYTEYVKVKENIAFRISCDDNNVSANAGKLDKIVFKNNTGAAMRIYLYGPQTYWFTLEPGVNKVQVGIAEYRYFTYNCDGSAKTGWVSSGDTIQFFCGD